MTADLIEAYEAMDRLNGQCPNDMYFMLNVVYMEWSIDSHNIQILNSETREFVDDDTNDHHDDYMPIYENAVKNFRNFKKTINDIKLKTK